MDPAMFRWYAADMTQNEFMRFQPRSFFLYIGLSMAVIWFYVKIMFVSAVRKPKRRITWKLHINLQDKAKDQCLEGEILWWDRQTGRRLWTAGSGHPTPDLTCDF